MFTITTEQRQYNTYILNDQSSRAYLEVVPERGGIITRWQMQDQELLYLDQERFNHPELTVRGGIPILFPICGNLPDNTYTWHGQTYSLKQHGFARDLAWEVIEQIAEDDAATLTLGLSSSEQTRQVYPFEFQLEFSYRLQGNSLALHQRYTNRSEQTMPFSTGLHPYFLVADKTQLQFQIPSTQFQDQQSQTQHPFGGQFDFELDEIDVAFRQLSQTSALVTDQQRRFRLRLDYDMIYSTLVFWTVKGKDYYCLEPWTAPRNALNTGDHLIQLEPNATMEALVRLTVEWL